MRHLRDTRDRRTERWVRQVVAAIHANAFNLDLWECARETIEHPDQVLTPAEVAELVARGLRTHDGPLHLPYRFEGQRHRVFDLEAAQRRGYGACADASAAIAAAVLMAAGECSICYERSPSLDAYAHVRVSIGDAFVDAFPEQSLEVDACTALIEVTRESVRWPAAAEDSATRLLDARRRQDGPPSSPEGSTT